MELTIPRFNLRRKQKILATFIDETGRTFRVKRKYSNNTFDMVFGGKTHTYIISPDRTYFDLKHKKARAFYMTNNPYPIEMGHERSKDIDSLTLKNILDDKTVTDLFGDPSINYKIMLLLIIVVGILTLLNLLVSFGVIKVGG